MSRGDRFGALWRRLGLERPAQRAWAMYDWANSAFYTSVVTALFPLYYVRVVEAGRSAAEAQARLAYATSIAMAAVAVAAPSIGIAADRAAVHKRVLASFAALGSLATLAMATLAEGSGPRALVLFASANFCVSAAMVCYDALLPHVAREDELDRVSSGGYALGYLGGGLLLAAQLALVERPEWLGLGGAPATLPVRLCFATTALWWAAFTIPLWRRVPQPRPVADARAAGLLDRRRALARLVRQHPDALCVLLAFLVASDGINTFIRMATVFGAEHGLGDGFLVATILAVQLLGVPCAIVFGRLGSRFGTRPALFAGLAVYALVSIGASRMRTEAHFLVLALAVATVQGGCQSLFRSLFGSMVPRERSGEFFALFAVGEKVFAPLGPWIYAAVLSGSGSSRAAVLTLVAFFAASAAVLALVDVERGRRAAHAAAPPPSGAATR
jgi:UMF1 family MFS transporter